MFNSPTYLRISTLQRTDTAQSTEYQWMDIYPNHTPCHAPYILLARYHATFHAWLLLLPFLLAHAREKNHASEHLRSISKLSYSPVETRHVRYAMYVMHVCRASVGPSREETTHSCRCGLHASSLILAASPSLPLSTSHWTMSGRWICRK